MDHKRYNFSPIDECLITSKVQKFLSLQMVHIAQGMDPPYINRMMVTKAGAHLALQQLHHFLHFTHCPKMDKTP